MKIRVTQEHIDNGEKGACNCCPIALALIDAGWKRPHVGMNTMHDKDDESKYFATPPQVFRFMACFDIDRLVHPFEFELDAA